MEAIVYRGEEEFGRILVNGKNEIYYQSKNKSFLSFIEQFIDREEFVDNLEFVRDLRESLFGFYSITYINE